MTEDLGKRKLLSIACHAAIFLSATVISFLIPLIILFISNDLVVQDNAKEALNFHFNVWFYGIIIGILTWVLVGFLLWPFLFLLTTIAPILAIIQVLSDPNKSFRYPFIFRLI